MKKKFLTLAILSSFISSHAQEIFSDKRPVQTEAEFTRKINDISYDIDVIIKTNKDQLKEELNKIEKQVESNQISKSFNFERHGYCILHRDFLAVEPIAKLQSATYGS